MYFNTQHELRRQFRNNKKKNTEDFIWTKKKLFNPRRVTTTDNNWRYYIYKKKKKKYLKKYQENAYFRSGPSTEIKIPRNVSTLFLSYSIETGGGGEEKKLNSIRTQWVMIRVNCTILHWRRVESKPGLNTVRGWDCSGPESAMFENRFSRISHEEFEKN